MKIVFVILVFGILFIDRMKFFYNFIVFVGGIKFCWGYKILDIKFEERYRFLFKGKYRFYLSFVYLC